MAAKRKPAAATNGQDTGLTVVQSLADLKLAYGAKAALLKREHDDFKFALGAQWSTEDRHKLELAGIKPFTDNRIAPNLFLLTGLERQNRTDFQAFPIGDEDGVKAEIASALFKDVITKSDYSYKSSEQFKDGITCGESHLELYLDYTDSIINAKPCWSKCDGNTIFPDPTCREYDFSDARYVYKIRLDIDKEDLINLYPEQEDAIEAFTGKGQLDASLTLGGPETHRQRRDYPAAGTGSGGLPAPKTGFDLIERYYKKWVPKVFVGDKQTGSIKEAESKDKATGFVQSYQDGITADQTAYETAVHAAVVRAHGRMNASRVATPLPPPAPAPLPAAAPAPDAGGEQFGETTAADEQTGPTPQAPAPPPAPAPLAPIELTPDVHEAIRGDLQASNQLPPPPPQQDPARFIVFKRQVPEIWCFAHVPGMDEPLCDERAWFYPKWKQYPFVPYFARFSTAPLTGEDRQLLVQGVVAGVKGAQEKHNKAEMLMLRHLNSATNSGWLSEEDVWLDPAQVKAFGAAPGVNLEYKQGRPKPERIEPAQLSSGHAEISESSAEAIKAQLGINADLLATQQGGTDSGRAIALRQKQGLLMVQELFDNLTRSRVIAGRFLLSQLGEIYDTETAMKVLGDAWLKKMFPPLMLQNPDNPQAAPTPMVDKSTGLQMDYDHEMAELAITEVLNGTLGDYDVAVGESVASETQKMAASQEMKDISAAYPGLVPPDLIVKYALLPESAKMEITSAIERAQAASAQTAAPAVPGQPPANRP